MIDFSDLQIVSHIGDGGMGSVYLVRDSAGADYALKKIKGKDGDDARLINRFLRESRIALRLIHPRIVRTHNIGRTEDGTYFILTEYCPDGDLGRRRQVFGPPTRKQTYQWMADTAAALHVLNGRNVIHRDIKPANLLMTIEGRAKLGDLGLARGTSMEATRLTGAGVMIGTLQYTSPEQIQGVEILDVRSDIYSMGASFFEIIAGTRMFDAVSAGDLIMSHLCEEPKFLQDLAPDTSPDIVNLIHSMLEKKPLHRPQIPLKILSEIRQIADREGVEIQIDEPDLGEDPSTTTEEIIDSLVHLKSLEQSPDVEVAYLSDTALTVGIGRMEKRREAQSTVLLSPMEPPLWASDKAILSIHCNHAPVWKIVLYTGDAVKIGRLRNENVDLCARLLPKQTFDKANMKISGVHAVAVRIDDRWFLKDSDSRNGTQVNNEPIPFGQSRKLENGDKVNLGGALILTCGVQPSGSVVLVRRNNRPDILAALLVDSLIVGGENGLALPDETLPECGKLLWRRNRFWWREHGAPADESAASQTEGTVAVANGMGWESGGAQFRLDSFTYDVFR